MNVRQLSVPLIAAVLLASAGVASATIETTGPISHVVVSPDAITLQMMLAQRSIRNELTVDVDWRAVALESLRDTLARPYVAHHDAEGNLVAVH